LIWFDPNWSDLNQFDWSWSNLNQFRPILANLIWFEPNNQNDPSWSFFIQFEPIWSSLIHFGQIWSNLIQNKTAIFILIVNVTTFYSIILWSNRHWGKWLQQQNDKKLEAEARLLKLKNRHKFAFFWHTLAFSNPHSWRKMYRWTDRSLGMFLLF
jgi:hypothetical protein